MLLILPPGRERPEVIAAVFRMIARETGNSIAAFDQRFANDVPANQSDSEDDSGVGKVGGSVNTWPASEPAKGSFVCKRAHQPKTTQELGVREFLNPCRHSKRRDFMYGAVFPASRGCASFGSESKAHSCSSVSNPADRIRAATEYSDEAPRCFQQEATEVAESMASLLALLSPVITTSPSIQSGQNVCRQTYTSPATLDPR